MAMLRIRVKWYSYRHGKQNFARGSEQALESQNPGFNSQFSHKTLNRFFHNTALHFFFHSFIKWGERYLSSHKVAVHIRNNDCCTECLAHRVSLSHKPSLLLKVLISSNTAIVPIGLNFVEMLENLAHHTTTALWTRRPTKVRIERWLGTGRGNWNYPHLVISMEPWASDSLCQFLHLWTTVLLFWLHTFVRKNKMICLVSDESVKYNSLTILKV